MSTEDISTTYNLTKDREQLKVTTCYLEWTDEDPVAIYIRDFCLTFKVTRSKQAVRDIMFFTHLDVCASVPCPLT